MDRWADELARGLLELGLAAGDRVLVQLPNEPVFVAVSVALFRIGAVPVYLLPVHRRAEVRSAGLASRAVAWIGVDQGRSFDFREMMSELLPQLPLLAHVLVSGDAGPHRSLESLRVELASALPDPPKASDLALLLLSGATTGQVRLIPRTHADYGYQLRATAEAMGFDSDGVYLAVLPVGHNAALGCPGVLGALRVGGRVVLAAGPSPDTAFELIVDEAVTLTTLMSPLARLWVETAELCAPELDGVVVQVGGARLDPTIGEALVRVLGVELTHWFGMGEGMLCFTRLGTPLDVVLVTQGKPLCADDELLVVDFDGQPVAMGEVGELLVRGPYTIRGYYDSPEVNARAFTADGFLRTGDLARLSPAGDLMIAGRLKEIVNRGGEKVAVVEVEDALRAHPAVADAVVVSMPDPVLGERVCAFVSPRGAPPSLGELQEHLRALGMASFKHPERLEILSGLPRSADRRVDRASLQARVASPR